jgi:hypothetical protein
MTGMITAETTVGSPSGTVSSIDHVSAGTALIEYVVATWLRLALPPEPDL